LAVTEAVRCSSTTYSAVDPILKRLGITKSDFTPAKPSYLRKLHYSQKPTVAIEILQRKNAPSLLPRSPDQIHVFTDGSKSNDGVGFAAVIANFRGITKVIQRKLSSSASVFEAEAAAIATALQYLSSAIDQSRHTEIYIFSGSRSALQAINSFKTTTSIGYTLQKMVHKTSAWADLSVCWIPAHTGITGNELADRFAKAATLFPALDRTACKPSWQATSALIHRNLQERWNNEWQASKKGLTTKLFFPRTTDAYILSKTIVHELYAVLAGHPRLRSHHHGSDQHDSTCHCRYDEETIEHVLFRCPDRNPQRNILRRKLQASGAPAWPPPLNFLVSTTQTTLALNKFIKSLRPIS